ncbi:MAG: hypothetical protein JXR37_09090 [Kiritimatiellae bacterium]|nr:hypothetical protein [Kiritimatiellia bacterium]
MTAAGRVSCRRGVAASVEIMEGKKMGWLEEIKKMDRLDVLVVVLSFFAIVGPGLLLLYHFKPELVKESSALKLVFLSISFTLPICLINMFVPPQRLFCYPDAPGVRPVILCASTGIIYYLALLVAYLFGLRFKVFLGILAGLETLFLVISFWTAKGMELEEKSPRRSTTE